MSISPAMKQILRGIERSRSLEAVDQSSLTPEELRSQYASASGVLERIPPVLEFVQVVQDLSIPARDGYQLPARLYAPVTAENLENLPTLLFLHGGGFVVGSIETHDVLCRTLAEKSKCAVLSLEYRLAPEHKFPTAVYDAWDALLWLKNTTDSIAVGGDSAGGTLAAVCALMARDAGIDLALQLLIYPGTCAHQDTPSHERFAQGYVLEREMLERFFNFYIGGDPSQREDWRFAPLLAEDFSDLAPAYFCLAELDPLIDEGIAYADTLRMSGVEVDLDIYQGVTHEFIKMGGALPEARQAQEAAAAALRGAFF